MLVAPLTGEPASKALYYFDGMKLWEAPAHGQERIVTLFDQRKNDVTSKVKITVDDGLVKAHWGVPRSGVMVVQW